MRCLALVSHEHVVEACGNHIQLHALSVKTLICKHQPLNLKFQALSLKLLKPLPNLQIYPHASGVRE